MEQNRLTGRALNATGKHRYRCRVTRASFDPAAPEANTSIITLRADNPTDAQRFAHLATGARVLDSWRDDAGLLPCDVEKVADADIKVLARVLMSREQRRAEALLQIDARFPGMLRMGVA